MDVSAALALHPRWPAALRLLAEALRRCVRTTDALRAAAGVLRDCLRSAPDDAECRVALRRDTALLHLHGRGGGARMYCSPSHRMPLNAKNDG